MTPARGTILGALLLVAGGVAEVAGSATAGTLLAFAGFLVILKYRVLPARRRVESERQPVPEREERLG
ncbi:MAG TPA: hypothetical protein VFB25_06915 [Gaiellaceae bacterium]|nr:hypothetical protein [Gaiellaceae bacterium]